MRDKFICARQNLEKLHRVEVKYHNFSDLNKQTP